MPKSVFTEDYRQFLFLLIEARNTKNFTQKFLADQLGKPQSFVSNYKPSERRLDVIEFLLVSRAIDIDPVSIDERNRIKHSELM